jgi:TPR repeat protein
MVMISVALISSANADDELSTQRQSELKAKLNLVLEEHFSLLLEGRHVTFLMERAKSDFDSWAILANAGVPDAEWLLGMAHDRGWAGDVNHDAAMVWLMRSSDQHYAPAQSTLGRKYLDGYGVEADHSKAVEWYTKATDQGFAEAELSLAWMNENGVGLSQNYVRARVCLANIHPR